MRNIIFFFIVVYKDREVFVDRDYYLIFFFDNYECRKYISIL